MGPKIQYKGVKDQGGQGPRADAAKEALLTSPHPEDAYSTDEPMYP